MSMLNIKKLKEGCKPPELSEIVKLELQQKMKDDNKRSDILICPTTKERYTPDSEKMANVLLAYGVRDKELGYN
jgi:hypothetical protein